MESVACFSEEKEGLSVMAPTVATVRAWHLPLLVAPASEPFQPVIWCLKQCLWSHFLGTAAPIEPSFTSLLLLLAFLPCDVSRSREV